MMARVRYMKLRDSSFVNFFEDGTRNTFCDFPLFQVSHPDEEDIETEDEESRGSDTTEEKRIGSTLCSLIGVSNKGVSSLPLGV